MSKDLRPPRHPMRSLVLATVIGVIAGCASTGEEPQTTTAAQQAQERDEAQRAAERREAERAAAREEAERQAAVEAERRAEAERKAREEQQAQAEAERKAREEAQRQTATEREAAEAEAERRAQAELQAREEAVRQAEAERQAREAEQRRAREEAERRAAAERAAQAAEERQAREEAQQLAQASEEARETQADETVAVARPEPQSGATTAAEDRAAAFQRDAERAKAAQAGGDVQYDGDRPTPAEIARLGNELTPMGSLKAGNADGSIPPWTGGITQPPAGYSPGDHHPNPFPNDKILFTIDSGNYREYQDKLSPGQIAMFERYPDSYRMNVYQTRRTTSFPQRIYDKTMENARSGRLTPNGEGVLDVAEGFPFPIPKNGPQLIWNHKLKYKGVGQLRYNNQIAPTAGGAYTVIRLREELLGLYWKAGNTIEDIDNILLYFYQLVEGPARLAGNVLLVHETLNQVEQLRQAWIYNPGQRRVRRAPNVAYDNPGTASDGLRTNDMTDMFNGALDRYVWRLADKKEMYVPYNSYDAHSDDTTVEMLAQPGHLNPDHMRYELHRVWIVDANLKEGVRHINPRRTFYLDEDSYQILLADHYDSRMELWRFSEAHSINYYDVPTFWATIETHHDLQSGRYIAVGLDNEEQVNDFNFNVEPTDFTPQALRKRGRR